MKGKLKTYMKRLQEGASESEKEALRKQFTRMLDWQIEKIVLFLLEQQGHLAARLSALGAERELAKDSGDDARIAACVDAYRSVGMQLLDLLHYVETNAIGIRKILKKFDKRAAHRLTDYYVASRSNHPYSQLQQVFRHVVSCHTHVINSLLFIINFSLLHYFCVMESNVFKFFLYVQFLGYILCDKSNRFIQRLVSERLHVVSWMLYTSLFKITAHPILLIHFIVIYCYLYIIRVLVLEIQDFSSASNNDSRKLVISSFAGTLSQKIRRDFSLSFNRDQWLYCSYLGTLVSLALQYDQNEIVGLSWSDLNCHMWNFMMLCRQ